MTVSRDPQYVLGYQRGLEDGILRGQKSERARIVELLRVNFGCYFEHDPDHDGFCGGFVDMKTNDLIALIEGKKK